MSKRQKVWARRKRQELMTLLGSVCAHCGTNENLQFDCIFPRGSRHHRGDVSQRMCFYRRQFREGNLQILCGVCNARKGDDKPVLVLTAPLAGEPF
jgi:hypothetical protein